MIATGVATGTEVFNELIEQHEQVRETPETPPFPPPLRFSSYIRWQIIDRFAHESSQITASFLVVRANSVGMRCRKRAR